MCTRIHLSKINNITSWEVAMEVKDNKKIHLTIICIIIKMVYKTIQLYMGKIRISKVIHILIKIK